MENYKNKEEFDRSRAFTFYAEWTKDAQTIEEDYGLEGVGMLCKAIWSYALYEIETDDVKRPPIKYFWNSIKEKIDASQEHRSRGFQKEDVELTNKIIDYKNNNPDASQREIANVIGCSVGKVNKALKNTSTDITTVTTTSTSTSTTTTVNVNVNAHDSQEEEKTTEETEEKKEEENNASKILVGECINHSQDVHKTLVGDEQNTRSNASETLVEIIHDNTLNNTPSIAAEEKTEESQKKEDTFINFLKELNCTQLQQIKDMYAKGTPYKEIASTYNIKYFDAAKFADNYDSIYKERYDMEHPEELERRQQQEQAWREREHLERAEDAEIAEAISHIKINKHKPVQCDNKPKPSTAKQMPMIDGSAIDSRLAGIPYPESMLDNINNGIITIDELVELQFG